MVETKRHRETKPMLSNVSVSNEGEVFIDMVRFFYRVIEVDHEHGYKIEADLEMDRSALDSFAKVKPVIFREASADLVAALRRAAEGADIAWPT